MRNGLLNAIIGDISTSGIMTVASGFPNFVTLGSTGYFSSFTPKGQDSCTAANFCASSALSAGYVLRPDIVPGVPLINPKWKDNPFGSNFTPYLNPAAFAVPGSIGNPRLGNAPRTLPGARTPREFIFDARVMKGVRITERYSLNLTATLNNAISGSQPLVSLRDTSDVWIRDAAAPDNTESFLAAKGESSSNILVSGSDLRGVRNSLTWDSKEGAVTMKENVER
jgi:hypothetical protein